MARVVSEFARWWMCKLNPDKGKSTHPRWEKFKNEFRKTFKSKPLHGYERVQNRENLLKFGVFIVFAVCVVIWFNENKFVQPYNNITIPKPDNLSRNMTAFVNVYSFTFGAQSNVDVYVTLYPDDLSKFEWLNANRIYDGNNTGDGLPSRYYMLFDGTFCGAVSRNNDADKYTPIPGCALPLDFNSEKGYYQNKAVGMTYPIEGVYRVSLSHLTGQGDNAFSRPFIKIAPLEATLNDINSKAITTLTVIGIYVAIVALHLESRRS